MNPGYKFNRNGKQYVVTSVTPTSEPARPGLFLDGLRKTYRESELRQSKLTIECLEVGPEADEKPEPPMTLLGFPVVITDNESGLREGEIYFGPVPREARYVKRDRRKDRTH